MHSKHISLSHGGNQAAIMKGETMEFYVYIAIVIAAYIIGVNHGKAGKKEKKAKQEKIGIYQV
jgi:hypothetical protein